MESRIASPTSTDLSVRKGKSQINEDASLIWTELLQFDPKINYNKTAGKQIEGKLLEQKRTQRLSLLSQASTRPTVSFMADGSSFNVLVPKRIAI